MLACTYLNLKRLGSQRADIVSRSWLQVLDWTLPRFFKMKVFRPWVPACLAWPRQWHAARRVAYTSAHTTTVREIIRFTILWLTCSNLEMRTHLNPALWPDVQDPALKHPFSHRIAQIVQAYKTLFAATGKEQPLIKNAGWESLSLYTSSLLELTLSAFAPTKKFSPRLNPAAILQLFPRIY